MPEVQGRAIGWDAGDAELILPISPDKRASSRLHSHSSDESIIRDAMPTSVTKGGSSYQMSVTSVLPTWYLARRLPARILGKP
jgi:hypothetical protein